MELREASKRLSMTGIVLAGLLAAALPPAARAQCILANPSFELTGSSGEVFAGWNQFGDVGSTAEAVHGSLAARVTGPDTGGWDVSGYWQRFDTAPGETWTASVRAWHSQPDPVTSQSSAILNIEWRDSGGNLIDYESYTVINSSTPLGEVREFSVTSGPAPSGTAAVHLLLGVLQGPSDPVPVVFYDTAEFYRATPPTIDDVQWDDFPGGRTVEFSGRTWRVKGPGYFGPGPNLFSDDESDVWVDAEGRLHLTITRYGDSWYSTEVVCEEALGYGDYLFTTSGRLDLIDPTAVLGIFLWQYGQCWDYSYLWWNAFNEIDVEFSRWGDPGSWIGQFVAQPYDYPGNIERFDASFTEGELTTHAFRWTAHAVEYRSWRGGPQSEEPASMIHEWTYTGPHIPRPEQPRVHLNLWRCCGEPPARQEVVFDGFMFVPEGVTVDSSIPLAEPHLYPPVPNPFNPSTTISFRLDEGGHTDISVYDVNGRLVRNLLKGFVPAGEHDVRWDGRNNSGESTASGVYLCRLKSGDVVETMKMVLLR